MIMTVYSLVPGAPLPEELEREDRPVYVPPDGTRPAGILKMDCLRHEILLKKK